jgi:hypothetical protein
MTIVLGSTNRTTSGRHLGCLITTGISGLVLLTLGAPPSPGGTFLLPAWLLCALSCIDTLRTASPTHPYGRLNFSPASSGGAFAGASGEFPALTPAARRRRTMLTHGCPPYRAKRSLAPPSPAGFSLPQAAAELLLPLHVSRGTAGSTLDGPHPSRCLHIIGVRRPYLPLNPSSALPGVASASGRIVTWEPWR